MGSDSDLVVMKDASETLNSFGIKNEVKIVSAHRTVSKMIDYAKTAKARRIQVIIAGAGGAAHLPGMVAAITTLPVIGVPIMGTSSRPHGLDSLLSIVQMPPGVPVATVAVNGAKNAGILAASIVGTTDSTLLKKIAVYKNTLKEEVTKKADRLEKIKYKKYLDKK